jgi:hypothetical protein
MLQYAVPPSYQRQQPIKQLEQGRWLRVIDAILEQTSRDRRSSDTRRSGSSSGSKMSTDLRVDNSREQASDPFAAFRKVNLRTVAKMSEMRD